MKPASPEPVVEATWEEEEEEDAEFAVTPAASVMASLVG